MPPTLPASLDPSSVPIWWITHEFSPFRGGAAVYVEEIARAAAHLSMPGQVVTANYCHRLEAGERVRMHAADSAQPFPVVRLPCSGRLTPAGIWGLATGIHGLRGPLRHSRPVLLSAGAQMAAFLLQACGQFPAARTTCFFHGSELLRFGRHPFWRSLARRFYSQASGLVVASEFVRDLALRSGLLPANPVIHLAPCAVPSAYTQRENQPGTSLQEQGAAPGNKEESILILTVARLHPRKGQLQVAEALALLPGAWRSRLVYRVVGTGDPDYRRQVESVCAGAGIRSEFCGVLDDPSLASLFAAGAIYAQASQTMASSVEGFGISLLEAGFFGCPIAAFRSGGVAEAVRDGQSAILVAEGDVPALSSAIANLIADPELRQRMGSAGREHARTFSWTNSARTFARVIHN